VADKTGDEILNFYRVGKLEELSSALANKVLRRLMEMKRGRSEQSTDRRLPRPTPSYAVVE
jgi:hypothetical protein